MTESDRSVVAEILEGLYIAFGKKAEASEKRQFLDVLWPDLANYSIEVFKRAAHDIRTREGDTEEERKRRAYFPTMAAILAHCKAVDRRSNGGPDGGSWYAENRGVVESSRASDLDVWLRMNHSFCQRMSDSEIECANRARLSFRLPPLVRTALTPDGYVRVSSWNEYERVQALQNFGVPNVADLDRITTVTNVRQTQLARNISRREGGEADEWFDKTVGG